MPSVYIPSFANADIYTKYYNNQAGYGDYPTLQTYKGTSYQRGYGIGSIFSSIIKGITPLFQSSFAKQAGKSLLNTGLQVGSDILQGQNLKDSAKFRFKQAGSDMVDRAAQGIRDQIGSGRKRRRKRKKNINNSSSPPLKKRKKSKKRKSKNKRKKRKGVIKIRGKLRNFKRDIFYKQ